MIRYGCVDLAADAGIVVFARLSAVYSSRQMVMPSPPLPALLLPMTSSYDVVVVVCSAFHKLWPTTYWRNST